MQQFSTGDKVRFLDEPGKGEIIRIIGLRALVLRDDGFELEYRLSQLVMDVPAERYAKLPQLPKEVMVPQKKMVSKVKTEYQKSHPYEIDLHIEELTDDWSNRSNSEILLFQISRLKDFLNRAVDRCWTRVVIIHGVGEGVLKSAVYEELRKFDNAKFFDASAAEYGRGATEVQFRYR